MNRESFYQFLADFVLVVHFGVIAFVLGGLVLFWVGNLRDWRWANALPLRLAHLVIVLKVAVQAWLGMVCPLTSFEMWLRKRTGGLTYSGSFFEYWVQRMIYENVPPWVFMLGYTLFGVLVVFTWLRFPPAFGRRRDLRAERAVSR